MRLSTKHAAPGPARERTKYPWAKMRVGQSFFVKNSSFPKSGSSSLRSAAFNWARKSKWKLTTRKEKGGYRVWRIK